MDRKPKIKQLQPTGEWILIRKMDVPDVTDSGLHMPGNSAAPEEYAEVISVGSGFFQNGSLIRPRVKPGQVVMIHKGRGVSIRLGGETVFFVTERDFLATIEPEAEKATLETAPAIPTFG